jgi:hypothetical protein
MSRRTRLGPGSFRGGRAARSDQNHRSQLQEMPHHDRYDPSPRPAVPGNRNALARLGCGDTPDVSRAMAQPRAGTAARPWVEAHVHLMWFVRLARVPYLSRFRPPSPPFTLVGAITAREWRNLADAPDLGARAPCPARRTTLCPDGTSTGRGCAPGAVPDAGLH